MTILFVSALNLFVLIKEVVLSNTSPTKLK